GSSLAGCTTPACRIRQTQSAQSGPCDRAGSSPAAGTSRCGQNGKGSGPKPRDVQVRISPSAPRKAIPVLSQTGLTCTFTAVVRGSTPLSPTASGSSSKVEREKEHC